MTLREILTLETSWYVHGRYRHEALYLKGKREGLRTAAFSVMYQYKYQKWTKAEMDKYIDEDCGFGRPWPETLPYKRPKKG